MKWLSLSNNSRHEIYELWNNEVKLLTLAFQPGPGTLRISTGEEKRVFLLGREGFLRSRTVLRNEYGIRMGQLSYESSQDNSGYLEYNNEKFNYSIEKDLLPILVISKQGETFAVCELPVVSKKNFKISNDLLILTLSWYIFTSVGKIQVAEYA